MKGYVILFIKGFIIGIANAIPGVSGGTLAFVLGIYERLTFAIAMLPSSILKPKELIKHLKILIPVGLGAFISIVLFLNIITILFSAARVPTQIFFVGLVLGSLPLIYSSIDKLNYKTFISFFFGAFIMSIFAYFNFNVSEFKNVLYTGEITFFYGAKLFIVGILASIAMVIPGISGSLLLLVLGEYENIAYYVKTFELVPIVLVGVGVAIGIFTTSKIVSFFISKYKDELFSFVLGVILVSLITLWPSLTEGVSIIMLALTVLSFCMGFIIAIIMNKAENIDKTN